MCVQATFWAILIEISTLPTGQILHSELSEFVQISIIVLKLYIAAASVCVCVEAHQTRPGQTDMIHSLFSKRADAV